MWLVSKEHDLCINLNWVEAFLILPHGQGRILFPWGNDPLDVSGFKICNEIKVYLQILPPSKRKLRLFHEFKSLDGKALIDLSEIKVIRNTPFGIVFYRRFNNDQSFWTDPSSFRQKIEILTATGEVCRADQSEWNNCCSELESETVFLPRH